CTLSGDYGSIMCGRCGLGVQSLWQERAEKPLTDLTGYLARQDTQARREGTLPALLLHIPWHSGDA
ncbi:MAG: hypothetical protein ACOC58_04815, partial [Chloroflexota bacterium]